MCAQPTGCAGARAGGSLSEGWTLEKGREGQQRAGQLRGGQKESWERVPMSLGGVGGREPWIYSGERRPTRGAGQGQGLVMKEAAGRPAGWGEGRACVGARFNHTGARLSFPGGASGSSELFR